MHVFNNVAQYVQYCFNIEHIKQCVQYWNNVINTVCCSCVQYCSNLLCTPETKEVVCDPKSVMAIKLRSIPFCVIQQAKQVWHVELNNELKCFSPIQRGCMNMHDQASNETKSPGNCVWSCPQNRCSNLNKKNLVAPCLSMKWSCFFRNQFKLLNTSKRFCRTFSCDLLIVLPL